MTKEDKELLLKDLCARLPHGLIIDRLGVPRKVLAINPYNYSNNNASLLLDRGEYMPSWCWIDDVKPYLRPMSSMTEEEKELCNGGIICYNEFEGNSTLFDVEGLDYLNKNMFDYRGLIPKGLALIAPDGMYKVEEQQ